MYYTYIHSTPDGAVFYVGKGTKNRVYSMSDRSWLWRNVVKNSDGILMKIVKKFDTEDQAFKHEEELIAHYKQLGCELVNLTVGGKGVSGYMQSEESRKKKSDKMRGYKYETVVCPHCGTAGGKTSIYRWHFDNCKGAKPRYKIRTTVFGNRVYLGKQHTKEKAEEMAKEFYDFVMSEFASLKEMRKCA